LVETSNCTAAEQHGHMNVVLKWMYLYVLRNWNGFFFFGVQSTLLARQVQQERAQMEVQYYDKEARKRLARRHSRNGPWNEWQAHTHVVK